jgi:hypothetical protein
MQARRLRLKNIEHLEGEGGTPPRSLELERRG